MEGMLKSGSLKGKTIIITGGGTGLGKSMGKYMLELGANLVITSRKKDVLEKTANELKSQTGGKVLPVACDIRKYEEIVNVIKETEK
jgi:short-subunit dehydrogenase